MVRGVGRRGISPVIASVLMILLVIFLAAIVFLWARGFVSEQIEKFGVPIEETCLNVKFDVSRSGGIIELYNYGNVDIRSFEAKMLDNKGNSEIMKLDGTDYRLDAGDSISESVTFIMEDGDSPSKMIIYPVLVGKLSSGSNSLFTCVDSGVYI